MKIDLHVHTEFSYRGEVARGPTDSTIRMEEIPNLVRRAGLDGAVITDHMTCEAGQDSFRRIQFDNPDLLLLRGMEYSSDHGHLLLYGVSNDNVCRTFGKCGPAQKVIDYVNSNGGIVVPAHPYESGYTYNMGDKTFSLKGLAAVESMNGHLDDEANYLGHLAAQRMRLPETGGSDAHFPFDFGKKYTLFDNIVGSDKDLIALIKSKGCHPQSR